MDDELGQNPSAAWFSELKDADSPGPPDLDDPWAAGESAESRAQAQVAQTELVQAHYLPGLRGRSALAALRSEAHSATENLLASKERLAPEEPLAPQLPTRTARPASKKR